MKSFSSCAPMELDAVRPNDGDQIKKKWNSWAILEERGVSFCTFVRYSRTAQVQIAWLLICLSAFITAGIIELQVAISNETSSYKPEKKVSSIDYASRDASHQYMMPYIYIIFRILAPA